jgi:hypothetical protein
VPVKFKRRQKKPKKHKQKFNAKPGTGMAVIVTRETAGVSTQTPAGDWELSAGNYVAEKLPMRMIAPSSNATSDTYIYENWYPGMALSLPICVMGGAWPFRYELVTAPAGMTIGEYLPYAGGDASTYGRISWTNPTTTGSPHTVKVRVTDQDGSFVEHEWSLAVSTSKFVFVDSVNGDNGNSGTISSPYADFGFFDDTGKNVFDHGDKIAVYRTGTYATSNGSALALSGPGGKYDMASNKPRTHIGYPGETAVFDFSECRFLYSPDVGNNADVSHVGLKFIGLNGGGDGPAQFIQHAGHRGLLYDNLFSGEGGSDGVAGNNPCLYMTNSRGTSPWPQEDHAFVYNTIQGVSSGGTDFSNTHGWEAYGTQYFLMEGNTFLNYASSGTPYALYTKEGNKNGTVRNNRGLMPTKTSWLYRNGAGTAPGGATDYGNVEVCYNLWQTTNYCVGLGIEEIAQDFPHWVYRNTLQTPSNSFGAIRVQHGESTDLYLEKNVLEHSGDDDGVHISHPGSHTGILDIEAGQLDDADTDYADSNGDLNPAYSANVGTDGHVVSD